MEQEHLSIRARIVRSVWPTQGRIIKKSKRRFLNNLPLHFRPTNVPESTVKFTLTWGLGGMAAVLVVGQFVTGVLLKFVYSPFPGQAYESIRALQNDILFGKLIRNVHHWSANLLVLIVFLHFLRVFYTGAYHVPRQFNWVVGLGLFAMVLLANFTGYLLPYDQLAYWAVTICTGLLDYVPGVGPWVKDLIGASPEVGPDSLKIFYTFHTAVIPVLLAALMAYHFWRIRKAGGLVVPAKREPEGEGDGKKVPVMPNLIAREAPAACSLIAFVMVLSVLFEAPLGDPANPGLSPDPT